MTREQEWEAALQQRAQMAQRQPQASACTELSEFERRVQETSAEGMPAVRDLVRKTYPHLKKPMHNAIIRETFARLGALS